MGVGEVGFLFRGCVSKVGTLCRGLLCCQSAVAGCVCMSRISRSTSEVFRPVGCYHGRVNVNQGCPGLAED